ncbi:MAG: polymer-forming cytoskeletal protein [Verrucomicrobiia bacterium]
MFNDVLKKSGSSSRQEAKGEAEVVAEVEPVRASGVGSRPSRAVISEDVEFRGNLFSASPLEIHGKFQGEIEAEGPLVIGQGAKVKANIKGVTVEIHGTVEGNITASERVELKANAYLKGDVRSPKFACADSATLSGSLDTSGGKPASDMNAIFTKLQGASK